MTYRRPGHAASCTLCGNGLDRAGAFYDGEGRVVCRNCHSRGEVAVANQTLKRWKVEQSPAAYAGAVAVTIALVAVGWVARWSRGLAAAGSVSSVAPASMMPDARAVPSASASSAPSFPPADIEAGCQAVAAAECDQTERQGWNHIERAFGTRTRCIERGAILCVHQAHLPHSGMTPDALRACAAAGAPEDPACLFRGTQPRHLGCATSAQCATGQCVIPRGATCGFCGDPPPTVAGAPCQVDQCGTGFACVDRRCVVRAALGEACDEAAGCMGGARCEGGRCIAAKPSVVAPVRFRHVGERCDSGNDSCVFSRCAPDDKDVRRCEAYVDLGEPCDDTTGDPCMSPGRCLRGMCTLPEDDTCQ